MFNMAHIAALSKMQVKEAYKKYEKIILCMASILLMVLVSLGFLLLMSLYTGILHACIKNHYLSREG